MSGEAPSLPTGGERRGDGDTGSRKDWRLLEALSMPCALAICCISAEARFEESFLNKLVFPRLFSTSLFLCRCLTTFLLAILMLLGSLLRPPVLMLVVSKAVARRVTASPPLISSCRTWVW